jgi:hypothetical protein
MLRHAKARLVFVAGPTIALCLGIGLAVAKDDKDAKKRADTSAQASAGDKGANVGVRFKDGVAFFQLTDKGSMASADIAGTKYWKNDDLNQ